MTQTLLGPAPHDRVALLAATGEELTYGGLRRLISGMRGDLRGLTFLRAELTVPSVAAYIACFEHGAPVLLLDRDIDAAALAELVALYRPERVIGFADAPEGYVRGVLAGSGLPAWTATDPSAACHPDLAVLLSTSGSTGSPKLVRLSATAVMSNADAIIAGLGIRSDDRAITPLPYSYTYGLSIINSHLRAGATVVVSDAAVVAREFWDTVDSCGVTALAGVPTTYKMLKQMRWDAASHPSVRYATQAGGRLSDPEREHFRDMFERAGGVFYVMYGQTEATARITITQPGDLHASISTAGRAIERGAIEIRHPHDGVGEVWYSGPNVMMGYAETADDLARGDEQGGQLETGDLGYLEDGKLFLTGRSKRIMKVFGKRVSLDDVDRWLHERVVDAVSVQGNDAAVVFVVGEVPTTLRSDLAAYLHVHPSGVRTVGIEALPLLPSGKIDFQDLNRRALS